MGLERGLAVARQFAEVSNVKIKYVCDIDSKRTDRALARLNKIPGQKSKGLTDFRKILDDKEVDALVCAAPNHWHGPATILGCAAGKHVYVEKPCSHTPAEGEMMVQAAREHRRLVQMGTQRRSSPTIIEAMQKLHSGAIGRVYSARCCFSSLRQSIGKGNPTAVPSHVDYELWQGPAPRRPYIDNLVHYNWHWRWHWGNGELGNNGIHVVDLARWGLQVDYPNRVVSSGHRYRFQDDQETPDTHVVAYEFGNASQITWQGMSHNKHYSPFISFFGEQGTLEMGIMGEYKIFDARDKEVENVEAPVLWGRTEHAENYIHAIRNDDRGLLNQEIESGHKSTMLSHLGNIAHRTGRTIECDPQNGHIVGDQQAMTAYWDKEYAPKWQPTV
jgi:predicted dehydrogenase